AAAEGNGDLVADLDAGGQGDVLVGFASACHQPITTLRQDAGAARFDSGDAAGPGGGPAEARGGNRQSSDPQTQPHQRSLTEWAMLTLSSRSRALAKRGTRDEAVLRSRRLLDRHPCAARRDRQAVPTRTRQPA